MQEYLENGVKLGWLIEAATKKVEIYRLGQNSNNCAPLTPSVLGGIVSVLSEQQKVIKWN